MKIFFVRHGITEEHEKKTVQRLDSILGERGKRQAITLSKRSRFDTVDLVISSKNLRAKQTAEILAENISKPLEFIGGIHEKEVHPKRYGEKFNSKINKEFFKELKKNVGDLDWKHGGKGESLRDVIKRTIRLKKHLEKNHKNQNLIVVSHGMFIGCFITLCLLGEKYEDKVFLKVFRSFLITNTGISLLIFNEEKKSWKVGYINDHSHLGKTSA